MRTMPSMMVIPGPNAATTSRSLPPLADHIKLSDIAPDFVCTACGKRAPAELGHSVKPARARKRPRPGWSNGTPKPLRAVAGASIAPPPNLRETIEIVPGTPQFNHST